MKFLITLLLSVIMISNKSMAQSNPDELVDLFFKEFKKEANQPINSIQKIKNNFDWARPLLLRNNNKEIVDISLDMIGKYNEAQLINKLKLAYKFCIYSYAIIYSERLLRFKLYVFEANSQWKISRIKIDEDFDEDAYALARIKN